MISLDPRSPVPLNEQIKAGIRGLVAKGLLRPGEPAPSVRSLAVALRVNPNTVARALRELADEGLIETRRGGPSVIAKAKPVLDEAFTRLRQAVEQARASGLSWAQIRSTVAKQQEEKDERH